MVVRRVETVSYTKCTKSAVIRQNTRNQRVAKLSVKYYISQLFNRQPKGLHVNLTQMLVKISPWAFTHESHALRRRRCSDYVWGPAPPTPELADVSTHRYLLCVSGTPSLAWYSKKNSQQDLSLVSSDTINQVVWNPVSVRTARILNDVMCYVTPGKGLTSVVSM